jgi:hypothetical protein
MLCGESGVCRSPTNFASDEHQAVEANMGKLNPFIPKMAKISEPGSVVGPLQHIVCHGWIKNKGEM